MELDNQTTSLPEQALRVLRNVESQETLAKVMAELGILDRRQAKKLKNKQKKVGTQYPGPKRRKEGQYE